MLLAINADRADAHSWYDDDCCNTSDCAPYEGDVIEEDKGYRMGDGELIPYTSKKIRQSVDNRFHLCMNQYTKYIYCLYVPNRGT